MIGFWLVAACLVAAALLFIVPPLMRKTPVELHSNHDQLNIDVYQNQLAELARDLENNAIDKDYYDRTYQEIERRLLQDVQSSETVEVSAAAHSANRGVAMGLIAIVPITAIYLYMTWGQPAGITGELPVAKTPQSHPEVAAENHPDTGAQVEAMVAQLAARMEQNPDDMEGWLMLARSYRYLGRHAEAVMSFERALPMLETNAQLMADYADTLAMATGGLLEGKAINYVMKALELDPVNTQSLWLAGTYHYDKGEFAEALAYWRRLKQAVPPGSQEANAMTANIAEIELRMKSAGLEIPAEEATPVVATKAPGVIAGTVRLHDSLLDRVSPDDTVFIFARAVDGPRMPLAIVRKKVSDLPANFILDESMAMMPAMSLSNYPDVIVGARISKTGNAQPQSGDLEGDSGAVRVGALELEVVIDSVLELP